MDKIKTSSRAKPAEREYPESRRENTEPQHRRQERIPPGPAIFLMAGIAALIWGLLFEAFHFGARLF